MELQNIAINTKDILITTISILVMDLIPTIIKASTVMNTNTTPRDIIPINIMATLVTTISIMVIQNIAISIPVVVTIPTNTVAILSINISMELILEDRMTIQNSSKLKFSKGDRQQYEESAFSVPQTHSKRTNHSQREDIRTQYKAVIPVTRSDYTSTDKGGKPESSKENPTSFENFKFNSSEFSFSFEDADFAAFEEEANTTERNLEQ
ncbi:hypothetical protein J6590_077406 [Homalodisca vitripennis]|nr:hypothetical protein J6590_077406 [Homalodisca vitripennis]